MRRLSLILSLALIMVFAGCSKHSAKEPDNQQASSGGSTNAPGSVSAPPAAPAPEPAPAAAPPPPVAETAPPKPLVIPAGTTLTVRLEQALGSKTSHAGDAFTATVVNPVSAHGTLAHIGLALAAGAS